MADKQIPPQTPPSDSARVMEMITPYKDKNFVQRIIDRSKYPVLPIGNGVHATHLMSWAEVDGKYIVYPNVIQDVKTKKLKQLGKNEAIDYAMKNGEYIPLDDPKKADWLSKNYKSVW